MVSRHLWLQRQQGQSQCLSRDGLEDRMLLIKTLNWDYQDSWDGTRRAATALRENRMMRNHKADPRENTYTHKRKQTALCLCLCLSLSLSVSVCLSVCHSLSVFRARAHTHIHARTHTCTHAHTYARTHARTHSRTHTHIYIYKHNQQTHSLIHTNK